MGGVGLQNEDSVLVVRPDRIGDVVLSTPVLAALKEMNPKVKITFLVRPLVAPLFHNHPGVDELLIYDEEGRHKGIKGFFRLRDDIRKKNFKTAIVLQSHKKVSAALFAAGVRRRIGPHSKLHSYLLFNEGFRQRRSLVEMHEADYNLQLLRVLGQRVGARAFPTQIALSEESRQWAKTFFEKRNASQPLVAIHPAMGGSALNWPEESYLELIKRCVREGMDVLVSAGPADAPLLDRIRSALGTESVFFYGGDGPIDRLAALFEQCEVVVAPSTGPLHIAVALGKRVVTFFPPIRVQSAIRWGPYLEEESRASVLVPENYCGERFKCRGAMCNFYPCMSSLTVGEAFAELKAQLKKEGQEGESVHHENYRSTRSPEPEA